jgi:hypothetical protein
MNKSFLILVIAGFLIIGLSEVQAQTTQPKLNQVELIKQMLGNWRVDFAKDTTQYWSIEPFGTGITCYAKTVVKNNTISETRELYGYDSKLGKYVVASLEKGKDIEMWVLWFTSNNKYIGIHYTEVSNPDKASLKVEGEIKSPDDVIQTTLISGKAIGSEEFKRIK